MPEISVYVEVTKQARQFEPVKIGISIKDTIEPKENESKKDAVLRGTRNLYDTASDQVDTLITEALNDLRG